MNTPTPNTPANAAKADMDEAIRQAAETCLESGGTYEDTVEANYKLIRSLIERDRAERDAELAAERVRIETQGHNVRFYADKSLALETKLAEQSAALDACKTAVELTHQILHDAPKLNMSNYHHDEVADINFAVNSAHKVLSDALAQIEALAGKGSNG